jgi:hypothetical protein
MTDSISPMFVPTILIGKATPVRRRLRSVLRRVVKEGSWHNAANNLEYVDINQTPGWIQIHGPMNLLPGENVVVWLTMEEVWSAGESEYSRLRHLLLDGLDQFWFALCLHSAQVFLPFSEHRDPERPTVARQALPKFLRHWEQFCRLERRYSMGLPEPARWPEWGGCVRNLCRDLGKTDDELASLRASDPVSAGAMIRLWLGANMT